MTTDDKKDKRQITIENLAQVLVQNDLNEVEYEEDGRRIYLSRKPATFAEDGAHEVHIQQNCSAVSQKAVEEIAIVPDLKDHPGTLRSPMVGTVYTAPEPGMTPFVRVGDTVKPGQTLLIIEAMKVLNPIKASKAGKVLEVFVFDQKPVEYDEPLMTIE